MSACDHCGCRFSEPEDELGDHPCPRCGAAPWADDQHDEEDDTMDVITAEEIRALNLARTTLERISTKAWGDASGREVGHGIRCGLVVEAARVAGDALFNVLNVANAYDIVKIAEDNIHNRVPADAEKVAA